ncbi:hypothetical protein Gohar_021251 [Gossypium harknessii]|uniref:Uncharacterized protein n=1 Tax=Gossypium harknessii TaxID=34285 RepID=A0A7J9IA47_9ROSI|nr:hypothetical protein [Gossypium harknessii]
MIEPLGKMLKQLLILLKK